MSRTLCQETTPYVGPMFQAHNHRCMETIHTAALGGTHSGPHKCASCGTTWKNTTDAPLPNPIVLCGATVWAEKAARTEQHTHHTCNRHVQDLPKGETHQGMHHCNCGRSFVLIAGSIVEQAQQLDAQLSTQARCIHCNRMRPKPALRPTTTPDGTTTWACVKTDACTAYVKGGTPSDGTTDGKGTPAQSPISLSGLDAFADEIDRKFGRLLSRIQVTRGELAEEQVKLDEDHNHLIEHGKTLDALAQVQGEHGRRLGHHADTLDTLVPDVRDLNASMANVLGDVRAIRDTINRQADGIAGAYGQLQDRRNDYDAVLQRINALKDDIASWRDYGTRRQASVNDSMRELAQLVRSVQRRLSTLEAAAKERDADDARNEHGGDWCPAQTGLIREPKDGHLLHTCSRTGVHAEHRCSCGTTWVSAKWPQAAVEAIDPHLVTGGAVTHEIRSAKLSAPGRAMRGGADDAH